MQARDMGLVQFHVVDPIRNNNQLGRKIQEAFGLQQALIFDTLNIPEYQLKKTIGLIAADYLTSTLKEGDILAISWGETIYHTIHGLQTEIPLKLTVVPAIGGSGLLSPAYQINEMCRKAADNLGGYNRTLYAPAFVESKATRDALMLSKDIQAITDLWKTVTIVLVGIGQSPFAFRSQSNTGLQFGQFYLFDHEQQELHDMDVAGDINARFFDHQGRELAVSVHERTIGMSLADIQRVPKVIAIAGGAGKVDAIYSAALGKNLDVLITDAFTAQKLLDKQVGA
jgi:DNA-binding transcriptional regulator LsrR (DeoR family)